MVSEEKNGLGLDPTQYLLLFSELYSDILLTIYTPDKMEIKKIFTSPFETLSGYIKTYLYHTEGRTYLKNSVLLRKTQSRIDVFVYSVLFVILILCNG